MHDIIRARDEKYNTKLWYTRTYSRRDLCKVRGGHKRHESDLRQRDGTWEQSINSPAKRGYHPCYSNQRHNSPLGFATWPGSYFIGKCANTRRSHCISTFFLSRVLLFFPHFFDGAFSIPNNFTTGPMKQCFDAFCFVKLIFPCVNKNGKTEFQCSNYFYRNEWHSLWPVVVNP